MSDGCGWGEGWALTLTRLLQALSREICAPRPGGATHPDPSQFTPISGIPSGGILIYSYHRVVFSQDGTWQVKIPAPKCFIHSGDILKGDT